MGVLLRTLLAGDWHGNTTAMIRAFARALEFRCDEVIQLGDFGFGWRAGDKVGYEPCGFVARCSEASTNFGGIPLLWIDGNHENHDKLDAIGASRATEPVELLPGVSYIPRGTVIERADRRVLCVGGAYSVDKAYRQEHVSWWSQEELTAAQVDRCLEAVDIDTVLSHDVANAGFRAALGIAADAGDAGWNLEHLVWKNDQMFPGAIPNRTRLEVIREALHPRMWIHGHYHCYYEADVDDTHFVGLAHECHPESLCVIDWEAGSWMVS